ncbi:hypothetical protein CANCADRAFT_72568 [Tortispora caseinolytica NRRL Y-17796]|uniref:HORMA domain-containing protein n=1 Tax=Tortispora caseinolytica NRRL Y-17796 TaxID=767744 RepID=A0A1E4TID9_9ASCO|nr:hypothetical protein CANCADRAFT_72568 [Tortispora caseinolytica NRRL Y-17796]
MVTGEDLLKSFSTFLEIATHQILYIADVYPRDTFLLERRYEYAVRRSRHRGLCEWIRSSCAEVHDQIATGNVKTVSVAIVDSCDTVIEQYVFDVRHLYSDDALHWTMSDFDQGYRAVLVRLFGSTSVTVPPDSTFTFIIELKDTANTVPHSDKGAYGTNIWITSAAESTAASTVTAIRSCAIGPLIFDLFNEVKS